MHTCQLIFEKPAAPSTPTVKVRVVLEMGANAKGEPYRAVNQVNTANSRIDAFKNSFEEFETDLNEMSDIIKSQGFEFTGQKWSQKPRLTATF